MRQWWSSKDRCREADLCIREEVEIKVGATEGEAGVGQGRVEDGIGEEDGEAPSGLDNSASCESRTEFLLYVYNPAMYICKVILARVV